MTVWRRCEDDEMRLAGKVWNVPGYLTRVECETIRRKYCDVSVRGNRPDQSGEEEQELVDEREQSVQDEIVGQTREETYQLKNAAIRNPTGVLVLLECDEEEVEETVEGRAYKIRRVR